jgi:hypothetical protein
MSTVRPSVDLTRDNPVGRVPEPVGHRVARLRGDAEGWTLHRPGRLRRRGDWARLETTLDLLDDVHDVDVDAATAPPDVLARWALRAAARGTLVTGDVPGAVVPVEPAGDARPGDLAHDVRSVAQRRAALATGLGPAPTVSAVLVTRRPALVPRILAMLDAQRYPALEVVLVVHGDELLELPSGLSVPVQLLHAPGDRSLGHALELGCAAASGTLLTKVDDDDFYGPDHVLDLVLAHRFSGALMVGKSTTVVHVEQLDVTVRRVFGVPEGFTHRVAGGTMLLSAEDLRAVGGWSDVPRAVDTRLLESVAAAGGTVYRPHDVGYLYVRHRPAPGLEHTWSTDPRHFLRNTREQWPGLLRHPAFGTA